MNSISLSVRAFIALILMAGFYTLAVSLAAFLLWLPYAELVYVHRLHIQLAALCVIGAGLILWSIMPRRDRFIAPGPELTASDQPGLLALVGETAAATGQPIPQAVYLVPDVNAWVAKRGGVMGLGGRRVMGLGLPLLSMLRVSELRAVLAHEFGHFHGGDTGLGQLVYQTRAAIGRTVATLAEHESMLQRPFIWYARLFLRISLAVSRQQEYAADRLAARIAGARPLISGLTIVHGTAEAFSTYWSSEVAPVLKAGFRPPLALGFRQFVNGSMGGSLMAARSEAYTAGHRDPFDTHPPLSDRIRALERRPTAEATEDDRFAIVLINDLPRVERALLEHFLGAERVGAMATVDWDGVGDAVYRGMWERLAQQQAGYLGGLTIEGFGERVAVLTDAIGYRQVEGSMEVFAPDERRKRGERVLALALAAAIARQGWTVHAAPGARVTLTGAQGSLDPFATVHELAAGTLDSEAWRHRCAELGMTGIMMLPADIAPNTLPVLALEERSPVSSPVLDNLPPEPPPIVTSSQSAPNTVRCWRCKVLIPLAPEMRGKNTRCPGCGTKQEMPR